MKNYGGLLVLVTVSFTQVLSQTESQVQDLLRLVDKCKQQSGAEEDVQELMTTLTVPTSHEGKCMVACVLQAEGLMKQDKVDSQAIKKFVEKNFPTVPQGIKTIAEGILKQCGTSGSSEKDKCENAAAFLACGKKALEGDFKTLMPSSSPSPS